MWMGIRVDLHHKGTCYIVVSFTGSSYLCCPVSVLAWGDIEQPDSSQAFTSIVHAFVCYRIDYCNVLLVGLPKVRLSPLQSLLNTAARLIPSLPLTYILYSAFVFDHLHWLPLIVRIQLKVLTLTYHSHIGQAPTYLRDLIRLPSSSISLRPLRSLQRHDFYGSDTSLCYHWPYALEPTSLFDTIHFINW